MHTFQQDSKTEQIISKWMDQFFFGTDVYTGESERNSDLTLQKQGLDILLKNFDWFGDNRFHWVDEKVATSYIRTNSKDENMHTFAFEIDYEGQTGARNEGWLFGNQFESSEYYLISWLWADVSSKGDWGNKDEVTEDNIIKAKCILIKKEKIREYLLNYKITIDNFMGVSKKLRLSDVNRNNLEPYKKTPNIQYSEYLKEKPVNVVISEYYLKQIATYYFEVTR